MLNRTKIIVSLALQTALLALPAAVLAAESVVPGAGSDVNVRRFNSVPDIIKGIVQFILIAAFVIAFIMLLVGGIRWILAGGDEKAVASARGMITAALIGLVIVVAAFAIIKLVETFFGFNILTNISIPSIAPPPAP